MNKHTPGPWKVESYREPYNAHEHHHVVSDGLIVAKCGTGFETKENALLIAAAPELLEALIELVDLVDDILSGFDTPDNFTTQPARVAIAKTRGEEL